MSHLSRTLPTALLLALALGLGAWTLPSEDAALQKSTDLCGAEPLEDRPSARVLAFAGTPEGRSSSLVSIPLEHSGRFGSDSIKTLARVEHPPGELPRASLSYERDEIFWVQLPAGARRGGDAQLWSLPGRGGVPMLRDPAVLFLQEPVPWGRCLAYLKAQVHQMDQPRFSAEGRRLQQLLDVELRLLDPDGESRILLQDQALWWQLLFAVPPRGEDEGWGLIALRIDDDGASLVEILSDGSVRSRRDLPSPRLLNLQPVPGVSRRVGALLFEADDSAALWSFAVDDGADALLKDGLDRYASPLLLPGGQPPLLLRGDIETWNIQVPEMVLRPGMQLWRQHDDGALRWMVEDSSGSRTRRWPLLPPDRAGQDLSLIGVLP